MKVFIVYSFGKCGSASLAGRFRRNVNISLKLDISDSEYIEHNVCHLHRITSLKKVIDTVKQKGLEYKIFYPIRECLVQQAMSSYFQYMKNLDRRDETNYKRRLIQDGGIRHPKDINDENYHIVSSNFSRYLDEWLFFKNNPGSHIDEFSKLIPEGEVSFA